MTDRVSVRNLRLRGRHGVLPEESRLGQEFQFDIDCAIDASVCAAEDDYTKAVCYASLCQIVRDVSDGGPFRLVETLADRVAGEILARHAPVIEAVVTIRKPAAPIEAQFDWVGVTVERRRRWQIGLSLGSNIGDKLSNLRSALAYLQAEPEVEIDRISGFYRTAPWGDTDQDWFLNACAMGWTTRPPVEMLKALKRIELQLGRIPGKRWGPRIIDIDLLFSGDLTLETPLLTLPHREMFNRAFVLVPLAEIAADHAVLGRSIGEAATALTLAPDEITLMDT